MNLAYRDLYRRKIWQRHEHFFCKNPDQKFLLFQNLLGWIQFYFCPHFIWTSSCLDWKTLFVHLAYRDLYRRKIWKFDNDMSTFFVENPDQKIPSVSEPTRMHTLELFPSFHLNKFITRLKNTFCAYRQFFSAKLDNDMNTFFSVENPDKKFLLFQNLLGCIQPAYRWFF